MKSDELAAMLNWLFSLLTSFTYYINSFVCTYTCLRIIDYVFRARKPNAPDDEPAVRQRHPKRRGPGPLQGEVPPEPSESGPAPEEGMDLHAGHLRCQAARSSCPNADHLRKPAAGQARPPAPEAGTDLDADHLRHQAARSTCPHADHLRKPAAGQAGLHVGHLQQPAVRQPPLKEWGRKVVINLSICHHPQRKLQARKGSNLTRLNLSNSLFTCGFVLLASTFLFYLPVRGEPDLEVILGAPALTPSSTDGIYTNDEDIQALSEPGGLLEGLSTRQSVQLAIERVELLTSTEAPYHQNWETYLVEYERRLAEMGEAPPTQAEVANIQALWAPLESLTLALTPPPEDVANESIPVSQISSVTAAGTNTSLDLTALPVANSTAKANGLLNQLLAAAAAFPNRTVAQGEVQITITASPEPGSPIGCK